jgi:hypothetical protein
MNSSPEILNESFCAYLYTVPNRERLAEHIDTHHLADDSEAITAQLEAVIKTCEDRLYNYPGGVPWTATFAAEFRSHLQQAYPWLNAQSFERIMAFAQWLCWHEGLDAPQ